jgi:hypothetical protein
LTELRTIAITSPNRSWPGNDRRSGLAREKTRNTTDTRVKGYQRDSVTGE